MGKKKRSKSMKDHMAYVRSFIGKKKGKKGGSIKDTMKYVRSFKERKKGGRFPKGKPSEWRAKAKKGSAKERAKFKRAIANWDKLMSQPGFKQKWNSNKIKKGGALEENINYRQLINMYQGGPTNAQGGAIPGYGYRKCGGAIRGYGIRGYGLPPAMLGARARSHMKSGGGIRGYGYVPGTGLMTPKMAKKFEQIYAKHAKKGGAITKRDLYRGGARQNSLFFTRNRLLKKQKRRPMTVMTPDDEMVQLYRNLYRNSGVRRENAVDPLVNNDRLNRQGGNVFKKIGRAVAKPVNFVKKHKLASAAASFIPGPVGIAARLGARALGAGLIEEAGLNGRGHPPYIYHG